MFRVVLSLSAVVFFASDAFARALPAICGDGIVGATEECDDGNTVDGDGCSALCYLELDASVGDDAGVAPDSGESDAGAVPVDDAGLPPVEDDAGAPPVENDAGVPPVENDAGSTVVADAGSSSGGADAGSTVVADAGSGGAGGEDDGESCGCTAASRRSGGAAIFIALLIAGFVSRARRS